VNQPHSDEPPRTVAIVDADGSFTIATHTAPDALELLETVAQGPVARITTDSQDPRLAGVDVWTEDVWPPIGTPPPAFVWALTAPSAFHLFVVEHGGTPDDWAGHAYQLLHDTLIRHAGGAPHHCRRQEKRQIG